MPVDNNEHQRIDDVSTDRISYGIQSMYTVRDNGFHIVTHELFDCFVQASQWQSLLQKKKHAVVNCMT